MITSKIFEVQQKEGVTFLQIPSFTETGLVKHGFSTRHGGVSDGIFASMNLGFNRGDAAENVRENFSRLCAAIGIAPEDMVFTNQVHEDIIVSVTQKDKGKGFTRESDLLGVDGFVTNESGIALVTFYADCVPLYFLDPVKGVIGLTHAGWRGTVKRIGAKTIKKMQLDYGSNPKDILAAIGPSIGGCCFEVSDDVKAEVEKVFTEDEAKAIIKNLGNNKYLVDLAEANKQVLIEAGLIPEHITKTDICTMCQKEDFFSHRGTGGQRGSLAAILALK